MKRACLKGGAAALAIVMFLTNVVLVHATETNFWAQRRNSKLPIQLAALPQSFNPSLLPPASALSSIVSRRIQAAFPKGSESVLLPIVKALPQNLGSVRAISGAPHATRTVIHIQDVHHNDEAQQNIAKTLQSLIDSKTVDLVALEGAFAPLDFTWIRSYPNTLAVKASADWLLKDYRISGPIHTAYTSKSALPPFVGIDDKTHYAANVAAYRAAAALMAPAKRKLEKVRDEIQQAKQSTFNEELKKFDARVESYRRGAMAWGDYVRMLSATAEAGHDADFSPKFEALLAALDLEKTLNFTQVEAERTQLITQLVSKLSKEETDKLLNLSAAYRLGAIGHSDFYAQLKTLCAEKGLNLARTPAMDSYIRYVLLSDSLDIDAIFNEISAIEKKIFARLAKSAVEKQLLAQSHALSLAAKLIDFSLTKQEWRDYASSNVASTLAELAALDTAPFEKFYFEAEARDVAMSANLDQAMSALHARVAVVVTGGFHTEGMLRQLQPKGVTVVSFAPKITKIEDENGSAYLSVFTQEKTPLDQLFAGSKLFLADAHTLAPTNVETLVPTTDQALSNPNGSAKNMTPDGRTMEVTTVDNEITSVTTTDPSRRTFLGLMAAMGLSGLLGNNAPAQTPNARAKTAAARAGLPFVVDPALLRKFAGHIASRKGRIFYRSNNGDASIKDWAFLYDNAIIAQIFISENSRVGLDKAVELLTAIQKSWYMRFDLHTGPNGAGMMGAYVSAVNANTGQVFNDGVVTGEYKVDSGPILHLGMAAINAAYLAKRLDPDGYQKGKYKVLVQIAEDVAAYILKIHDPKKGVRHGPWGKPKDAADQRFGGTGPALPETFTQEHQPEAYFILNALSQFSTTTDENKDLYRAAAAQILAFDVKTFWDPMAHRFHGALSADGVLSRTLPTDVQSWSVSMYGVETLLKAGLALKDLENMFAELDKSHAVLDRSGNIVGYDFTSDRREFASLEWTAQVAAAKLQFADYLRKHPDESKTVATPWNAYAGAAVQLLRGISQLKPGARSSGLPYTIDADKKPAEGIDTMLGWKSQLGEAIISMYFIAVARGYDPAALNGGKIDLQGMLAELKPADYELKIAPAADEPPAEIEGKNLLERVYHDTFNPRTGPLALYYQFNPAITLPAGPVDIGFTIPKDTNISIELILEGGDADNPDLRYTYDVKGTGQDQIKTVTLASPVRLWRVVFQLGSATARNPKVLNPARTISNPSLRIGKASTKKTSSLNRRSLFRQYRGNFIGKISIVFLAVAFGYPALTMAGDLGGSVAGLGNGAIGAMVAAAIVFGIMWLSPMAITPSTPKAGSKGRILVVEDYPSWQVLLHEMLEDAGFTVTVAANAKDALHQLALGVFDGILSDNSMANSNDGVELYRQIEKKYPQYISRHAFLTGSPDTIKTELGPDVKIFNKNALKPAMLIEYLATWKNKNYSQPSAAKILATLGAVEVLNIGNKMEPSPEHDAEVTELGLRYKAELERLKIDNPSMTSAPTIFSAVWELNAGKAASVAVANNVETGVLALDPVQESMWENEATKMLKASKGKLILVGDVFHNTAMFKFAWGLKTHHTDRKIIILDSAAAIQDGKPNMDVILPLLADPANAITKATIVFNDGFIMSHDTVELFKKDGFTFKVMPLQSYVDQLMGMAASLDVAEQLLRDAQTLINA
jgi:CheY-like chemotaxis protein